MKIINKIDLTALIEDAYNLNQVFLTIIEKNYKNDILKKFQMKIFSNLVVNFKLKLKLMIIVMGKNILQH